MKVGGLPSEEDYPYCVGTGKSDGNLFKKINVNILISLLSLYTEGI